MKTAADERTAVAGAVASLLGAATLSPLVSGITWLVVAGVIVVTVMVSGIIGRHLLNHWLPVTAIQVAVLLVTLEVLFARSRLLEGAGAVTALSDLLQSGLEVTRNQPPPVEASQGVILLAAGGTGIVALIVDVLACSLRQPALAGLPLLAIYCVPAALLPDGLPWYFFAAAAAGFLLLLAADAGERVEAWGRVLSSQPKRRAGTGDGLAGLGNGGRRAAAVAVVAAVLVPAIMPGLGNQILGGSGQGDGSGDGNSTLITRINPIIDLRKDLESRSDADIIWYRTDVKNPQPLRIVTADTFNGDRWAPNTSRVSLDYQVQAGMPRPQGLSDDVSAELKTTSIRIGALRQTYLPVPYPATRVNVEGDWLYDPSTLNVIGRGVTTQDLNYRVESLDVQPTAEQLADAPAAVNISQVYLSLPELPAIIRSTAVDVAKTGTQYQQAIRLQRYLRESGGFTYSTDAPTSKTGESSSSAIADFLRVKRGYCVHFASAMAVMARTLGIPSRVAIGFLPGERDADGQMVISVHDAHAWPELYFEGVGWVRFEPTPRTDEVTTTPQWAIPPAGTMPEDETGSATPTAQPSASAAAPARPSVTAQTQDTPLTTTGEGPNIPWVWLISALVVIAVVMTPWLTARVTSARRWSRALSDGAPPGAEAEAAWEELRLGLEDLGAAWAWTWTPRGVQQRLTSEYDLGDAGISALGRLTTAIEAARYAPPVLVGAGSPDLLLGDHERLRSHPAPAAVKANGFAVDLTPDADSDGSFGPAGSDGSFGPFSPSGPGGLRSDVRTVLDRIAAGLPRGRRLRARWLPPSAGTALNSGLISVLSLGRAAAPGPGPDGSAQASRGTDTLTDTPRD